MAHSKGETMKAVIWEGHVNQVKVKNVPRPTIEDAQDVVVKLTTSAICGTDLHVYHGLLGSQNKPWIMGHEGIGVITEVGSSVADFKKGDRVIIPAFVTEESVAGMPQTYLYGLGVLKDGDTTFQSPGGLQAEYARVPNADVVLIKLPGKDEKGSKGADEDFIMLSDIWCTAWGGLNGTGFKPGDSVAVFGAGPVGLLVAYSAILRGATTVYVVDHVESRLRKAKSIGAVPIDLKDGDPADQIKDVESGGVARVIDAIGYECVNTRLEKDEGFVINQAIKVVAPLGGIFVIGLYYAGKAVKEASKLTPKIGHINFPIADWFAKGATLAGGAVPEVPNELALFRLIESGRAKPGFIVDKVFSIEEAPEAYRGFSEHKFQKVIFKFEAKKGRKRSFEA